VAKYLLIDGPSLMFRAFYVMPPMRTASGAPTSALFGFLRMMLRAVQDTKADGVAVALDIGMPFRENLFADYKATREKTPEDLSEQLGRLTEVLAAMNVPVVGQEGLEADDLIAMLARRLAADGNEVLILTGDRDLLQLVDHRIQTVLTKKGVTELARYDATVFQSEYGFAPSRLPDYKALAGDASDNIPGVPGIGDKTARALVSRFGTLESIYEHLGELKPALRETLTTNRERAFEGRMLATLVVCGEANLPIPRAPDLSCDEAVAVLRSLEFGSLIAQYARMEPVVGLFASGETPRKSAGESLREEIAATLTGAVAASEAYRPWREFWAVNTRVSPPGADEPSAGVPGEERGLALTNGYVFATSGERWSAVAVPKTVAGEDVATVENWLAAAPGRTLFVDDWKSLFLGFQRGSGTERIGFSPSFDLSLAAFLLDPDDAVVLRYLFKRYLPGDRDLSQPLQFAKALFELNGLLEAEVRSADLEDVLRDWEIPMAEVVARMQEAGIRVDAQVLDGLSGIWQKEIEDLERTAEVIVGKHMNLSSPKQVASLLFDELGLPRVSKDSTAAEVLDQLKERHPIVPLILRHRIVTKLRSTYAEALKTRIEADGKVRTTYLQTGTATGRLSSRDPNLQNIPIHGPEAVLIRRAFVPTDATREFLAADYSQIDLRLLAHISGDEGLIQVFREGGDIHTETARSLFGITGEVDAEARRRAKAINFGIIYLMSDFGLSQELGCSREEAAGIIRGYFERFPGVKRFVEETLEAARERQYVTTLLGRRRLVRDIRSQNGVVRKTAERVAVNTRVQGSTADLLMMAMVELNRRFSPTEVTPVLQIHDEIVFEVPRENLKTVAKSVKMVMESVTGLKVPLVVHLKRGRNWGDLEAIREEDRV
jgi:DNA polymerase-1